MTRSKSSRHRVLARVLGAAVILLAVAGLVSAGTAVAVTAQQQPLLTMHRVTRSCWDSQHVRGYYAQVCLTKRHVLRTGVHKVPPPCSHCTTGVLPPAAVKAVDAKLTAYRTDAAAKGAKYPPWPKPGTVLWRGGVCLTEGQRVPKGHKREPACLSYQTVENLAGQLVTMYHAIRKPGVGQRQVYMQVVMVNEVQGNPHGRGWPFLDPGDNQELNGNPMTEIQILPGGNPKGGSKWCIDDPSFSEKQQVSIGLCSSRSRAGGDKFDSWMVWNENHGIGQFIGIHLTNINSAAAGEGNIWWVLTAGGTAVNDGEPVFWLPISGQTDKAQHFLCHSLGHPCPDFTRGYGGRPIGCGNLSGKSTAVRYKAVILGRKKCPSSDVQIVGHRLGVQPNGGGTGHSVVGELRLHTTVFPQDVHITFDLERLHSDGTFSTVAHTVYNIISIPLEEFAEWMSPALKVPCVTGRYRLLADMRIKNSNGTYFTKEYKLPANSGVHLKCPGAAPAVLTSFAVRKPHVVKFFIRNGAGGDMAYLSSKHWLTTDGRKSHALKFTEADVHKCSDVRCFELKVVGHNLCITVTHRPHRTFLGYKAMPCKKLKTQVYWYGAIQTPGHTLIDIGHFYCMAGYEYEYNLADPSCKPIYQGQESWYFRTHF